MVRGLPAQESPTTGVQCVECHGTPELWVDDWAHLFVSPEALASDIHWQRGIRCHDCHGGDPGTTNVLDAHAIDSGFRKIESPADIPGMCGHCHSRAEYMRQFQPDPQVNHESQFWNSAHGQYLKKSPDSRAATCTSCHPKHTIRPADDPQSPTHATQLVDTCGTCHQEQREGLLTGVHKAIGEGGAIPPDELFDCKKCHGDNVHAMGTVEDTISATYVHRQVEVCGRCHEKALQEYTHSVHGHGLFASGLIRTAVCSSCHGAHGIFPAKDQRSSLHPTQVAGTCASCHRFIEERLEQSVHGRGNGPGGLSERAAPGGMEQRKPSCTDCHQGHDLPHPQSVPFRTEQPNRCGNCHVELNRQFHLSLHGELTEVGYVDAAKCADCHGAHDILPVSDEQSTLSPANRIDTCRRCHERAPARLASYDPHADHEDRERSPLVYYVFVAMQCLLFSVFGFFGVHTGLWFFRSWLHRWKHRLPRRLAPRQTAIVRFEPVHRTLHVIIIVSFLMLALTGLPLRYSSEPWAKWLAATLGGFENTSLLHRLGAAMTLFYFASHLIWLARKVFQCRAAKMSWNTILFGPDSPVPNMRDLRDFVAMLKWFVGLGPRPVHERWTYWEKFDYWAVFWGVAVIGTSGLLLWFRDFFCRFLPGWTLNVAHVIHAEEALLATGFIFAIHFFNTHLRAERFPMDMGMLTGLVTEEELLEERPEFVERIRAQGRLDELRAEAPGKRALWFILLGGFLALIIGVALLLGMIVKLFG